MATLLFDIVLNRDVAEKRNVVIRMILVRRTFGSSGEGTYSQERLLLRRLTIASLSDDTLPRLEEMRESRYRGSNNADILLKLSGNVHAPAIDCNACE